MKNHICNLEVIGNKAMALSPFAPLLELCELLSLVVVVHGNVILLSEDWLCVLKLYIVKMAAYVCDIPIESPNSLFS